MFTGHLQLDFGEWDDNGRIAQTIGPVRWTNGDLVVDIPIGYPSDGASVPRFLWWFLPPWGDRATFAALLHDYLLDRFQGFQPGGPILNTRAKCDGQFLAALLSLGVEPWRAYPAWLGVRAHSIRLALLGQIDRPLA